MGQLQSAPTLGEAVASTDPAWAETVDLIAERVRRDKRKYGFTLRVTKLRRVRLSAALEAYEAEADKLGAPTRLFHGTDMASARAICESGFRLPTRKGMFGRGVYFADTPLKSAGFAPESSWWPFLRRLATNGLSAAFKREGGQMLLCDVYLGVCRTLRWSASNLDPGKDLRAGWFRQLFGLGDYNSVYAPGGLFAAVNVPEYIVYTECQGIPRYLVEYEYDYS
eukprot:CAMPEP_0179298308 /NCGR_PEP_ID=MMETSP0797-20121207/45924_1 /TAXON_ID=47934 /ORGANISM="Dinophysis acuminata, Strain DAEP01" /LENGTH=223 /DNA_ID=CAMNT_0021007687 /DNA_START=1 /DNA_END=672 /DNA_ORIENTATION=+